MNKKNDSDFKKLLADMERLSCLAHHNDQTDATLFDILWKAVDSEPWALQVQTKQGIALFFARAAQGISISILKHTTYKEKQSSHDPIIHGGHVNNFNDDDDHVVPIYS